MTEKQYRLNKWGTKLLRNNRPLFDWMNDSDEVVDLLNAFCDEIEQLKQKVDFYKYFQRDARELEKAYTQLKHRHSLLHDECIDAECERDSLKKDVESLEKENEQLKQTCQMVEDTYHSLQKKFHNWDIALSKCREENEQLKHDATVLIQANQDYRRENEQLKKENKELENKIEKMIDMIEKQLQKEWGTYCE